MQHSMFTRFTWHTFSGLFAQAAGEVLGVTDTEAMMEATRENYSRIVSHLPEICLSGRESSLRLITAIYLASLMSMDRTFTEEELVAYYEHAVLQRNMTLSELSRHTIMKNLCSMTGGLSEMFHQFGHSHLTPIICPVS